jgi:ABC-type xylose transport system permease subunit
MSNSNWNLDRWIQIYNGLIAALGLCLTMRSSNASAPVSASMFSMGSPALMASFWPVALIVAGAAFTLANYVIKRGSRSGADSPFAATAQRISRMEGNTF